MSNFYRFLWPRAASVHERAMLYRWMVNNVISKGQKCAIIYFFRTWISSLFVLRFGFSCIISWHNSDILINTKLHAVVWLCLKPFTPIYSVCHAKCEWHCFYFRVNSNILNLSAYTLKCLDMFIHPITICRHWAHQ